MPVDFVCRQCGAIHFEDELLQAEKKFANGTTHVEARCPDCNAFVQYLSQGGPAKLYFGKYKGKPIAEIARDDPAYLRWVLTQDWCKPKIKALVQAVLP